MLYSSLAAFLDDEDQLQLIRTNLLSTPCLWVGNGFAFPAVTALQAPDSAPQLGSPSPPGSAAADGAANSSGSALSMQLQQHQLLHLVSQSVQEDASAVQTLQALRVPQHWDFPAYAIALAVLAEQCADQALSQTELELSLQLADAAAAAQQGANSVRLLQQDHVTVAANALRASAAGPGGVFAPGGPDLLVLPDSDGFLAAPSELYFNDAAWLGAEGLRLAHTSLRQDTAEALGVRSMRWVQVADGFAGLHATGRLVWLSASQQFGLWSGGVWQRLRPPHGQSTAEYYQIRAAVQSLSPQVPASFSHVVASLTVGCLRACQPLAGGSTRPATASPKPSAAPQSMQPRLPQLPSSAAARPAQRTLAAPQQQD